LAQKEGALVVKLDVKHFIFKNRSHDC